MFSRFLVFAATLAVVLLTHSAGQAKADAVLLAHKTIHPADVDLQVGAIVAGAPTRVNINVFNVGDTPAYSVHVDDGAWKKATGFEIVGGDKAAQTSWEKIEPGQNVTFEFSVIASEKLVGTYVPRSPAQVFFAGADASDPDTTSLLRTTQLQWLGIESIYDERHRNAPHFVEWIVLIVFIGAVCGGPWYLHQELLRKKADRLATPKRK